MKKCLIFSKYRQKKTKGGIRALYNATGNGISEILMLIGNQKQSVKRVSDGIPIGQLIEHLLEFLMKNEDQSQVIKNTIAESTNHRFPVGNGHVELFENHGECCNELKTHAFLCSFIKKLVEPSSIQKSITIKDTDHEFILPLLLNKFEKVKVNVARWIWIRNKRGSRNPVIFVPAHTKHTSNRFLGDKHFFENKKIKIYKGLDYDSGNSDEVDMRTNDASTYNADLVKFKHLTSTPIICRKINLFSPRIEEIPGPSTTIMNKPINSEKN